MPGDPGYGSALLGYHYYTWAFIGFAVAIALIAVMLLFERQFAANTAGEPIEIGNFARIAVWLVIALTALNVISTLLECGFSACPDSPEVYELLKRAR
jgi:disulfide bond formation protein DsbB